MSERVIPREPGWWWAQWGGCEPRPTNVWLGSSGLMADDQTFDEYVWRVTESEWTWLEPIQPPKVER